MSTGDLITLLGNGGAIVVFCALLITGIIVPKWVHDDMKKQRDEWKRAAELSDARADAIMDMGRVTKDVMTSLHHELGTRDQGRALPP